MKKALWFILLAMMLLAISCTKKEELGNVDICVHHTANGNPLLTDTLCYINEAGNEFLVTEIQWFISKMELQNERGEWIASDKVFYIDTNIPESQMLRIDSIPTGKYKTVRFTFGLDEHDNQSGLFSNPPEANMFWPETLGGGYHYIKLNGKYRNESGQLAPLNIHLGRLQDQDHSFIVEQPIDFIVSESTANQVNITMIVDNWFRSPNIYDFNEWGSAIMQNEAAQNVLKQNGQDVFEISVNGKNMTMEKDSRIAEGFKNAMKMAAPKPHFWTWENVKQTFEQIKESTQNRL